MIRIAVTAAAFEAIAGTLALGWPPQRRLSWEAPRP
jgi:hypothetical protein